MAKQHKLFPQILNCLPYQRLTSDLPATYQSTSLPFQMELGGKDAAIVCADADIEAAAKHIVKGAFSYSGQRCTGEGSSHEPARSGSPLGCAGERLNSSCLTWQPVVQTVLQLPCKRC